MSVIKDLYAQEDEIGQLALAAKDGDQEAASFLMTILKPLVQEIVQERHGLNIPTEDALAVCSAAIWKTVLTFDPSLSVHILYLVWHRARWDLNNATKIRKDWIDLAAKSRFIAIEDVEVAGPNCIEEIEEEIDDEKARTLVSQLLPLVLTLDEISFLMALYCKENSNEEEDLALVAARFGMTLREARNWQARIFYKVRNNHYSPALTLHSLFNPDAGMTLKEQMDPLSPIPTGHSAPSGPTPHSSRETRPSVAPTVPPDTSASLRWVLTGPYATQMPAYAGA